MNQCGAGANQAEGRRQAQQGRCIQAAAQQGQALLALLAAHHAQQHLVKAHQGNQWQVDQLAREVNHVTAPSPGNWRSSAQ